MKDFFKNHSRLTPARDFSSKTFMFYIHSQCPPGTWQYKSCLVLLLIQYWLGEPAGFQKERFPCSFELEIPLMDTQQGMEAFFEIQVPEEDIIQNKLIMGHTYSLLTFIVWSQLNARKLEEMIKSLWWNLWSGRYPQWEWYQYIFL